MTLRLVSLLLLLLVSCVGVVLGSPQQYTLYHQLVHPESARDITPRGVITYDPTTNSASYDAQGEVLDLGFNQGIYRIGFYDTAKNKLSPAAFTKLGFIKGLVTEVITLYVSSDNVVYHISYVLKPSTSQNIIVNVVSDRSIPDGPSPKLNDPIVVNPDGQPPVEEEPKTFIQKYWIYLIPIVLIALTSGGGGGGAEAAN